MCITGTNTDVYKLVHTSNLIHDNYVTKNNIKLNKQPLRCELEELCSRLFQRVSFEGETLA